MAGLPIAAKLVGRVAVVTGISVASAIRALDFPQIWAARCYELVDRPRSTTYSRSGLPRCPHSPTHFAHLVNAAALDEFHPRLTDGPGLDENDAADT